MMHESIELYSTYICRLCVPLSSVPAVIHMHVDLVKFICVHCALKIKSGVIYQAIFLLFTPDLSSCIIIYSTC